jgi:hypothetical protein
VNAHGDVVHPYDVQATLRSWDEAAHDHAIYLQAMRHADAHSFDHADHVAAASPYASTRARAAAAMSHGVHGATATVRHLADLAHHPTGYDP